MTTRGSIRRAPDALRSLALFGKPLSQILLTAEVPLVWCPRYLFIVLVDVERDETPHGHSAVERVPEEPTMLQLSPERFDQGVRGDHIDLREHPPQ